MRVLILGGGEVGFHLAQRLSNEGQDVVLIDSDPDRAAYAAEQLDVLTIVGNGASVPVLEKAGVKGASMVLSVTSADEVNLIACLAASRVGVRYTVARVSNPDYHTPGSVLSKEQLGITRIINPEREAAKETYQLLAQEVATDVASFAEGRVQLIGLRVREGAPVAGKKLIELGRELEGFHYVTVAIGRGGETIIPTGSDSIEPGDRIYLISPVDEVPNIPRLAGYKPQRLQRVMIAGGSLEGQYLADRLNHVGVATTILDRNRRRCVELAELLPKSLVLHGDATDVELLEMEGVSGVDGFVASTGDDQTNLLSSLLAKNAGGSGKVIALIENFAYLPLVPKVGIDAAVSPRMSAVNAILRFIRRGRVLAIATMTGTDAHAIEFTVKPGSRVVGKTIQELHFPANALVGAIVRGTQFITPRGRDAFEEGDDVIVFGLSEALEKVDRMFA